MWAAHPQMRSTHAATIVYCASPDAQPTMALCLATLSIQVRAIKISLIFSDLVTGDSL